MGEIRSHQDEALVMEIMAYGSVMVRILPDGSREPIPRMFWVPEYVPLESKQDRNP